MMLTPREYTTPSALASNIDYSLIWTMLNSTIYDVIDEDDHLTFGKVRHFLSRHWLFVSDHGNYLILSKAEVEDLLLWKRPSHKG